MKDLKPILFEPREEAFSLKIPVALRTLESLILTIQLGLSRTNRSRTKSLRTMVIPLHLKGRSPVTGAGIKTQAN